MEISNGVGTMGILITVAIAFVVAVIVMAMSGASQTGKSDRN
jgi:hypothetical protein